MEGWKLLAKGRDISIQVLLHDPVEFPEVNKKGTFVDIGKEARPLKDEMSGELSLPSFKLYKT